MIRYKTILYLLIGTSPLINTSLIPGAKLPFSYLITLATLAVIVVSVRSIPKRIFGNEDIAFAFFMFVCAVSLCINASYWPVENGITQIGNLVLTYLIYKVSHYLMVQSEVSPQELLRNMFRIFTWLQVLAFAMLVVGHFNPKFNVAFIYAINNAGNFDVGAIESVYPEIRLTGFSPEPSFWSFFIAMNIAVALSIRRQPVWMIAVNVISLLATVGRTGYLIAACIVVLWFIQGRPLRIAFAVFAALILMFKMREYLDIERLMAVDASFRQRFDSMLVAVKVGLNNPLFGIGLGNFKLFAQQQQLEYLNIFNWYLSAFALTGLAGVLSLAIFLIALWRKISHTYHLPFIAGVIGWITVSAFNLPFVWVIFAALVYCTQVDSENQIQHHASVTE